MCSMRLENEEAVEFCKKILRTYTQLSRKYVPSIDSVNEDDKACKISAEVLVKNNVLVSGSETSGFFLCADLNPHNTLIKKSKLREKEFDINFSFRNKDMVYLLKLMEERGIKSVELFEDKIKIEYKSFPTSEVREFPIGNKINENFERVMKNFEQINMDEFIEYANPEFKENTILVLDGDFNLGFIRALYEYNKEEYITFLRFPKMLKNSEIKLIRIYKERLSPTTILLEIQTESNNAEISVFFKLLV